MKELALATAAVLALLSVAANAQVGKGKASPALRRGNCPSTVMMGGPDFVPALTYLKVLLWPAVSIVSAAT